MMSIENTVELNRKPSIVYTMTTKDDEKNSGCEKSQANLSRFKRDKSPSTCQNKADASNETADNSRLNVSDKKNENNHGISNELNGKRQKTVCYDFKKGICRRRFCRVSENRAYVLLEIPSYSTQIYFSILM